VALTLVDRDCPKCGFNQPRRLPRASWLERRLLPVFGCFPWECPLCRIHFYRKNRIDREERMNVERSNVERRNGERIQVPILNVERGTIDGSRDFASQEMAP